MSAPAIELLADPEEAVPAGARVQLRPIPPHEPPIEDPRGTLRLVPQGGPQLALPLRTPPSGPDRDPVFGPQITNRDHLPEPEPWSRRLLQAILETLAGRRSPAQLQYWTSWGVYRDIVRVSQRRGQPPPPRASRGNSVQISRVRVCEPADGVAEICAVARRDGRWHAVAARLEGIDGRWCCVSLTVG